MGYKSLRAAYLDEAFARECFPNLFLTDELKNQIEDLGRLKKNEAADGTGVPYNVLLVCDDQERTMQFLKGLTRYLEQVVPNIKGTMVEEESKLSSEKKKLEQKPHSGKVLAVIAADMESARDTEQIRQMLKGYPGMTKIICVTRQQEADRFQHDEELYWRLIRAHFYIRDLTTEEIQRGIEQKLESYTLTEEFRSGLRKYNHTVYPKASLRNDAYIADLYDRIISKYQKKERGIDAADGKILDGDCVPDYHAPEDIEQILKTFEKLHGYEKVRSQLESVCKKLRVEQLSSPKKGTFVYFSGQEGSGRKWVAEHILSKMLFSMGIVDLDGMLLVPEEQLDTFLQNQADRRRRLICVPDSSRILTEEEQKALQEKSEVHHSYVFIQSEGPGKYRKEKEGHVVLFSIVSEEKWAENFQEYCKEKNHALEEDGKEQIKHWTKAIFGRQMGEKKFQSWNSVKALYQEVYEQCVEAMSLTAEYTQLPVIRADYLKNICEAKADYHLPPIDGQSLAVPESELSDEKAVILLLPSDYKNISCNAEYEEPQDAKKKIKQGEPRKYQGIQTNDAPVEYLIDQVYADRKKLEKVICLTTSMANSPREYELGGKSVLDRLQKLVEEYLEKHYDRKEFADIEKIAVDYEEGKKADPNSDISRERIPQIFRELSEKLEGYKYVYIDYTGGLRDTSFLMVVIIRFLESMGIECRKVVYSNFHSKPKKLVDMTESHYKILQMINATDEFLKSGNARGLDEFFGNMPDERGCEKVRNVIKALNIFSDTINLCNLEKLDETVKTLVRSIEEFEAEEDNSNLYCEMFRALLPTIKKNMYIDVEENRLIDAERHVNYPQVIRWCLNYNLIQQALTLYVEKMPVYYFRRFTLSSKGKKDVKCKEPDVLYNDVYNEVAVLDKNYRTWLNELSSLWLRIHLTPNCNLNSFKKYAKMYLTGNQKVTDKLIEVVEKNYNEFNKIKENKSGENKGEKNGYLKIEGTKLNIVNNYKNMEGFIDALRKATAMLKNNNTKTGLAYLNFSLLFNEEKSLDIRMHAIRLLEKGKKCDFLEKGQDTLYQILLHYLVIKTLRNQINHANGADNNAANKDQNIISQYLTNSYYKDGKVYSMEMAKLSLADIAKMLNEALNFLDDAEDIVWKNEVQV